MVPEGDLESDDEDIDREDGAPLGIVTKKSKKKNKQQNITDSSTIKRGNVPGHDIESDRVTRTESGTRVGTEAVGRDSPTPSPIASDDEEEQEEEEREKDDEEETGQFIFIEFF